MSRSLKPRLKPFAYCLVTVVGFVSAGAFAQEPEDPETVAPNWRDVVRTYEPIYVGYTLDESDQAYMDFSLSVITPASILLPWKSWHPRNKIPDSLDYVEPSYGWQPRMYLAFSGRAGQYIGTRESSPVVGKSFNPLFAFRWWNEERDLRGESIEAEKGLHDYFELSYGHESNGQRIGEVEDPQNAEEENLARLRYLALRREYEIVDGDPDIARDELSRGWDYMGMRWASSWRFDTYRLFVLLDGRYFLDDGLLQGKAEEYNIWESDGDWLARYDGAISRDKVDGLRASVRYQSKSLDWLFDANEASLEIITGYRDPFERVTLRAELGFKYTSLWYRYGYNSDLVDYYRKDESWGFAIKIGQF